MGDSDLPLRDRLAVALIERSPQWSAMAACQVMGRAARLSLPRRLSSVAVQTYAKMFGVALDEVDPALLEQGFPTFDAFFTRTLRQGARTIDKRPDVLISPCDGRLRGVAEVGADETITAKGHAYGLGELLVDAALAERFVDGLQVVIYLHPRDYHRVHVPFSGMVRSLTLVPGRLLPVNDASVAREPRLFALNERHVHVLETDRGMIAVVLVAAFGVGHMSCAYRDVEPHPDKEQRIELEPAPFLAKGEELGVFHLGSTVVLLTEPGFRLASGVELGGRVEFGQALLEWGGEG